MTLGVAGGGLTLRRDRLDVFLKEGLEERWRKYRKARKRCRKKFSQDSVHAWRVETRRMLAYLSLLDPLLADECAALPEVEAGFRKNFKSSTRLRDTHVQLLDIESQLGEFPELGGFCRLLARRQKRLAKRLKRKLGTGSWQLKAGMGDLRGALRNCPKGAAERAHGTALSKAVQAAYRRVLQRRLRVRANRPATIHRMRIAFKKFRYMVEALQPVLAGVTKRRLAQMQAYQTAMGDIQDVEMLLGALDEFAREAGAPVAAGFRGRLRQRHAESIARFFKNIDQLERLGPPQPRPRVRTRT